MPQLAGSLETARQLRSAGAGGDWPQALRLLRRLRQTAVECGRFQYGAVLSRCAWPAAEELLAFADAAGYTAAMASAQRASQWLQGLRHLEQMALRRWVDLPALTVAARGCWQMVLQMGIETDAALSVVQLQQMNWQEVLNKLEAQGPSCSARGICLRWTVRMPWTWRPMRVPAAATGAQLSAYFGGPTW